jgi:hypothetical protein
MFSSFIPETELERAFVQSKQWDADLTWRRSMLYVSREQWGIGAGYMLSLALRYSFDGTVKEQAQTLASIAGLLEFLTQTEKHALFRACELVVALMLELPLKTIETTDVLLFVQLLLEIVASCPGGNFVWIDMFRRLSLIYERRVLPTELEELRARCFATKISHCPMHLMKRCLGLLVPCSHEAF